MTRLWAGSGAVIAACFALIMMGAGLPRAAAQGGSATNAPPAPAIVMVDMQQLIYTSKAGKGVEAQVEVQRQVFSKEVAQQEDQLHKFQSELERQRSLLAPDVLEVKNRELQQKLDELDRFVKARQQALQQSYSEALSKIEDEALRVVADIAAERGANLVIRKEAVIFSKDGFDITPDAQGRLDQRLPSVTMNPPKTDAAEAAGEAGKPQGQPAPAAPLKR
jgi:outer membrane protein